MSKFKVHVTQLRANETCSTKVCTGSNRVTEIGLIDVCIAEIRACHIRRTNI